MSIDQKIQNGDKVITSAGAIVTVEGNNKLAQDVVKGTMTTLGSNHFHIRYGSLLTERLIGNALPPDMAVERIEASVREAMEYLIELQEAQALEQDVTDAERIQDIKEVFVEQDKVEPRQFNAIINIITGELNTVQVEFPIEL